MLHCSFVVILKYQFCLTFLHPDVLHLRHKPSEISLFLSDFSPQIFHKDSHLPVFPLTNPHCSEVSEKQNRLLPFPAAILVIPTSPWLCPTLILPCHSVNILFSSVGAKQWVCICSWHICDEHTEFYQWGSQTPVGFRIMGLGGCLFKAQNLSLSPIHILIKWWGPRIFIINMDPRRVGSRDGGEKFPSNSLKICPLFHLPFIVCKFKFIQGERVCIPL